MNWSCEMENKKKFEEFGVIECQSTEKIKMMAYA